MFKRVDEDEVLIMENGVYKPAEVYEGPEGGLFIKAKGGFIRAKANGSTSHPQTKMLTLHREGELYQDQFGRLCLHPATGRRRVFIQHEGADMKMLVEDSAGRVDTSQAKSLPKE